MNKESGSRYWINLYAKSAALCEVSQVLQPMSPSLVSIVQLGEHRQTNGTFT